MACDLYKVMYIDMYIDISIYEVHFLYNLIVSMHLCVKDEQNWLISYSTTRER